MDGNESSDFTRGLWKSKINETVFIYFLVLLIAFIIYLQVTVYSFDWPRGDDFLLIDFYRKIFIEQKFTLHELFLRDGAQPVGVIALLSASVFRVAGIHFVNLVWLNFILVAVSAALTAATVTPALRKPSSRVLVWAAIPTAMCHPFQAELFFEANCVGWFIANALLLFNACLVERVGRFTLPLVAVTCSIAALSSAQGGLLWLASALHMLMRNGRRRFIGPIILLVIGLLNLAWLASSPQATTSKTLTATDIETLSSNALGAIVYFVQITGAFFSQRNPAILLFLGLLTLAMVAGETMFAVRKSRSAQIVRIGLVLIVTALASLALFTEGRQAYGLPWATWEFHMSPLIAPLLAGLALISIFAYDQINRSVGRQVLALIPVAYLFASVAVSLPDTLMREKDAYLQRVLAKHTSCSGNASRFLLERTNIADGYFQEVAFDLPLIRQLCSNAEPPSAKALEDFPPFFSRIVAHNEDANAPLHDLWELYQTQSDLVRVFPIGAPDSPEMLLRWAKGQAAHGSGYAPQILAKHEAFFRNLKIDN